MAARGIMERVIVSVEAVTKGFRKGMDTAKNSIVQTRSKLGEFNSVMGMNMTKWTNANKAVGMSQKQFKSFHKSLPIEQLQDFGLAVNKTGQLIDSSTKRFVGAEGAQKRFGEALKTSGGKSANGLRRLTHGLRGFRMEMLGVMFFGMGLAQFFKGLLSPAMKLSGLFEVFTITLQTLFIPIALAMMDFLLPFLKWVMNLSDGTKLLIGKLVILGAILGTGLFLFGMFALGIGSVILAMGGLFTIIDKLIPDVKIAGINFSSFIEAGLGITIISTLFKTFKGVIGKVLDKILELDIIQDLFDRLGLKIDDNMSAWDNLKLAVKTVMDKIKKEFNLDSEEGIISGLIDDLKTKFGELSTEVKNKMEEIGMPDFIDSFKELSDTLIDITPSIKTIADAITAVADAIEVTKNLMSGQWLHDFGTDLKDFLGQFDFLNPSGTLPSNRYYEKAYNQGRKDDFIWRPGQGPISINPNDTLVGFKGAAPDLGGGGGANITNNFNGFTLAELDRALDDRDRRMVDDIRRLVKQ